MNMRIVVATVFSFSAVFAGLTVGVGSGGEAFIGYRWGKFIPYVSPSFVTTGGAYYYHYRSHNDNLPWPYQDTEQNDTLQFDAGLLLASIGARAVFGSKELKPCLRVSAGLPLPVYLHFRSSDTTGQHQLDSLKSRLYENPEPTVILGAATGLETFISRRVSIGGEISYTHLVGGAWLKNRYNENEDGSFWEREESRIKFSLGKIGSALWLNFYF
jgi:hypothetical protein